MKRTLVLATLLCLAATPSVDAVRLELESRAGAGTNLTEPLNLTTHRTIDFGLGGADPAAAHPPADAQAAPAGEAVAPEAPSVPAVAAAAGMAALATLGVGLAASSQARWAILGLLAPLFSRIQGEHVLEHGVRQRIHQAVVENPGITLKEVAQSVGVGWGTAVHHLGKLEQERLIVSERSRQFRRFYKNGGGIVNEQKAAFGELKHPTCQRIAAAILTRPGQCQKDVCEEVGISAPLAHKYLGRLHQAGLIDSQREWKSVKYFPTPRLQELLAATRPEAAPVLTLVPA